MLRNNLKIERQDWKEEQERIRKFNPANEDVIELNVGGVSDGLTVSKALLCSVAGSKLHDTFSGKFKLQTTSNNKVFLDRDPKIFSLVLNFLRNSNMKFDIQDKIVADLFKFELRHWRLDMLNQL